MGAASFSMIVANCCLSVIPKSYPSANRYLHSLTFLAFRLLKSRFFRIFCFFFSDSLYFPLSAHSSAVFLKHPDFLRSVQISGDKFRSSGLLSKIFGFGCLFRHLTLDAVSASLLDASSTFILDAALTSSSVRSAMTMQTTALACSACSLPSLHSPYHSVIFKFDFSASGVLSLLLPKTIVWRASADRGRSGFGFFLCRPLPFCILPYRSRPPLLLSYIDKQELCADGLPFSCRSLRFGLRHRFCLFRLDLFRCLYYHYSILLGFVNTFFENFFNFFVKHLQKKK